MESNIDLDMGAGYAAPSSFLQNPRLDTPIDYDAIEQRARTSMEKRCAEFEAAIKASKTIFYCPSKDRNYEIDDPEREGWGQDPPTSSNEVISEQEYHLNQLHAREIAFDLIGWAQDAAAPATRWAERDLCL
jgi:hypothetical protein